MKSIFTLFIFCFSFTSLYSQDTFSICAVDTVTGEVGSAGASCLDENNIHGGCSIISDVHPGIGVIHSQAYWLPDNQEYARKLMYSGLHPAEIIDSLLAHDSQNYPYIRQYGIVSFYDKIPEVKGYTGEMCDDYKSHIEGRNYCIQGNTLLGQKVLDSMQARFLRQEGDLACKLMAALQGAKMIGADTRCTQSGNSSLSSFLRVAKPGDTLGTLSIDIVVSIGPYGYEPIDSLQYRLDQIHTCITGDVPPNNSSNAIEVKMGDDNRTITIIFNNNDNYNNVSLEIFDLLGKPVFSRPIDGNTSISPDRIGLVSGKYLYRITKGKVILKAGNLVLY